MERKYFWIRPVLLVLLTVIPKFNHNAFAQLTENQMIEKLISSVENLDGAKFYRNGSWYSPKEAADHLRLKLSNAGSRIKTARQFIDKIASNSSMSGKSYKIKFKDGSIVETKVYLNQQLGKLK